ncbi:MAG: hypothetical protein DMG13_08240 [Acidobacteria bacterium]|nr:MAG: hypothetical protein DMG13_08240 [Acidobacteriota bacterium]
MKLPARVSVLFFIGVFAAGSTALGYYYYFVYSPPLKAAARFMDAMEAKDAQALGSDVIVSSDIEDGNLREPEDRELQALLSERFQRGRILDQRKREGRTRTFYYLVYREPDGRVFALVVTEIAGRFRVVIPEVPMSRRHRYLWDYTWTN